ncbi:MAG: hypothetical protein NTX25_13280, partial [Proteobacteria bacterium]|nr:hypothetical protein [Pseudomonadota bacterium]
MYPILWQSGTFILSSWHVFYVLAAFVAWWSLQFWSARIWPESQKRQVDTLFLLLYVSGYFGARGLSL